jgi:hypothetical protein
MENFKIVNNGSDKGGKEFLALDSKTNKLIATISSRLEYSGKYSSRFMNICFIDGTTEIADREEGGEETMHASELIANKYYL